MEILEDISNNNGAAAAATIADPKIAGVYAKVSQGVTFGDPNYPIFRSAAAKAHKPIGGYMFLEPNVDGDAQAVFFLNHAKPGLRDLQPVVDSETLAAGSYRQAAATTLKALETLAAHGYEPLLYASTSFLQQLLVYEPGLKRYRVWQAQYASFLQRIPGLRVVLWQFTDRMVVGKGRFQVDGDKLLVRSLDAIEIKGPVLLRPKQPRQKPIAKKTSAAKAKTQPAKKAAAKKAPAKKAPAKKTAPSSGGERKNQRPFTDPARPPKPPAC